MINLLHHILPFKRISGLKCVLLLLVLFLFTKEGNAQVTDSITLTLVKAPCNNDGILVATAYGVTPPFVFYWELGNGITFTDTVKNRLTDTLYNYSGGYVLVAFNGNPFNGAVAPYASTNGYPPFAYTVQTTNAICPNKGTATATVTGGTLPYTIEWLGYTSNAIVATGSPASLSAGEYNISITDGKGCTFSSLDTYHDTSNAIVVNYSSNVNFQIATTPANCTNGTASVNSVTGAFKPYTYLWTNGANSDTVTGLIMGEYSVTVTDSLGCSALGFTYVQQSVTINVNTTVTNATCLQDNGSAIAFGSGGKPPYTYLWNNGESTQTSTNMVAGYYNVTVTDANNCIGSTYADIAASTPITVTYSTTASLCTAPTGTATLTISGGTGTYTVTWYTYPAQTGITATGLAEGTYSFLVTDAVGCIQQGTVYIPPISVLYGEISENDAVCTQANGSASAIVTYGTPPYTYAWSTGSTAATINNIATGGYSCTITNSQSCSIVKSAYVGYTTPLNIGFSVTPASCYFSSNGSITANATNGTAPYTYHWSNGETGATATGLQQGEYYVYINDAAGCVLSDWADVSYNPNNDSCYCTITGTVYNDLNNNCVQDAGELGIQNIMIQCSPVGYTFTDANGNYSFIVPSGTYTLSEVVQYYYPLASCQDNAIVVNAVASPGCTSVNNFANVINPIHDMSITTTDFGPPIPGGTYTQQLFIQNNGTITEPGIVLGYADDGQLAYGGVNPFLFAQQNAGSYPNWYSVLNGFPSLAPGASQELDVTYKVPTNIPINTRVNFFDTVAYVSPISNWLADYSPWNNVNQYAAYVEGSFDPNNKQATPQGSGPQGYINSYDSIITYTVHFQNTGNYAAQKVVVTDTLSSNLDFTTLKPGFSNHTYTTTVSMNGVATFTFNNIGLQPLLDYENSGASIGYFSYSAHLKHNLAGGTEIESPASVYFDYNAPVRTNTAMNTINFPSGTNDAEKNNTTFFTLYPNPANGNVTLVINAAQASTEGKLSFYNLLGEVVSSQNISLQNGRNIITADVSSLPAGMYFVKVYDGQNMRVEKLSVMK